MFKNKKVHINFIFLGRKGVKMDKCDCFVGNCKPECKPEHKPECKCDRDCDCCDCKDCK